jgi:hypothetical protein
MAEIARKVETFNLAFQLAWKYISDDQKRQQPNVAGVLSENYILMYW